VIQADERGDALADADRLAVQKEKRRLRSSLHAFVQEAWAIIEPSQEFQDNWHIREMCRVLEYAATHKDQRVIINIPPGCMKSLLVSVLWPAWMWAKDSKKRVITASYSGAITIDQNRKLRDLVTSEWYQNLFDVRLVEDQNTKIRFNTQTGGWRIATSVGGALTGEHPDVIIIDDVVTAEQAQSDADRKAANKWFDNTVSTRGVARGVCIIIIAQRLHEDDLPGYLLERGGWEHVCFPMRYEKCTCVGGDPQALEESARCILHKQNLQWRPDPRDPRTDEGELLWPKVFDETRVKKLENDLLEYGTSGQLQQRPAPGAGGLFKREWFKFIDAAPRTARRVRGWDTAGSEGKGDYTVGARISEVDGIFYVEDVQRDQLDPDGVDKLIYTTAQLDGQVGCAVREEKEGGASGLAVIKARAKLLRGWDYMGVAASGSKVTRSKPFRSQCAAGNVFLVKGPWNEKYIAELCAFPTAKHDDQVDASSCAFNAVLLEPPPARVHEAIWG
jgi:predicted phage terminase large subunit-like protein